MKSLCGGSMRTGRRLVSAPAPDDEGARVTCPRCGREFRPLRGHTAQVPRHLPPRRPTVLFSRRRPSRVTMSRVAELSTTPATTPAGPPPFVTVGPHCLRRTSAEFPDELLYVGSVAPEHVAWLKSINLLEGPWEWVIQQGGETIDFSSRRFPTRTEAAGDLLEALDVLLGGQAPSSPDEDSTPVVVAAAGELPAADADPDVIAWALDLAILKLQRARASFPAAARQR